MNSDQPAQLFIQSTIDEMSRFWAELNVGNIQVDTESVLDIGCNFPALFLYLFHIKPNSIGSYLGVDSLSEHQTNNYMGEAAPELIYSKYSDLTIKVLNETPLPQTDFENTFHFKWTTSLEELTAQTLTQNFSFICLRNVLHFISPDHDHAIIDFVKYHLKERGTIYLEALKSTSSISHGRQFPFDNARINKFTKAFKIMDNSSNEEVYKLLLAAN